VVKCLEWTGTRNRSVATLWQRTNVLTGVRTLRVNKAKIVVILVPSPLEEEGQG